MLLCWCDSRALALVIRLVTLSLLKLSPVLPSLRGLLLFDSMLLIRVDSFRGSIEYPLILMFALIPGDIFDVTLKCSKRGASFRREDKKVAPSMILSFPLFSLDSSLDP